MVFTSIKDEGIYDVDFHLHSRGYYLDIELALTKIKQIHPYVKYTKYKPILNKNIISKISINFEVN